MVFPGTGAGFEVVGVVTLAVMLLNYLVPCCKRKQRGLALRGAVTAAGAPRLQAALPPLPCDCPLGVTAFQLRPQARKQEQGRKRRGKRKSHFFSLPFLIPFS